MTERAEHKVRENRSRRAAKRQGKLLIKSRRRDPNADGYEKYVLVSDGAPDSREVGAKMLADTDGVYLEAIEAFLNWRDIHVIVRTDASP